jgi:hypothetical protein
VSAPVPPEPGEPPPETGLTPEDIERARAAWERAQLPEDKKLLDAEPANIRGPLQ